MIANRIQNVLKQSGIAAKSKLQNCCNKAATLLRQLAFSAFPGFIYF